MAVADVWNVHADSTLIPLHGIYRPFMSPFRSSSPLKMRRWTVLVSVLAHVLVLAALLWVVPRTTAEGTSEPSYDLVFNDGSAPAASTAPEPSERPNTEPPTALPEAPIAPQSTAPTPEEPPAPTPAPTPATPPEPAPEPIPEPLRLEPAPPAPPPPVPETPSVRLDTLPDLPPSAPRPPDFIPPAPPPPLPPPQPPPVRASRPVQQARRAPEPGSFAAPLDLNFGPLASRPGLPRGSRGIDLTLGAPKPGPNRSEAFFDARARAVGAEWASGLEAYWRKHRYYPSQAIQNGEDGTVQVEITVNRLGKVESVEVVSRSGSPWLDMAALGTWRGAQLAPFPAENNAPRVTTTLTINYILIR